MTAGSLELPTHPATAPPPLADSVPVDLDQLIVGRTLQHPINDVEGRLLLAAGQQITIDFKHALQHRRLRRIRLHRNDVSRATMAPDLVPFAGRAVPFETELSHKLDAIISAGMLVLVANRGPAVRDSLVLHGHKLYDKGTRDRLVEELSCLSSSLDGLMQNALQGRSTDGGQAMTVIAQYVGELCADCDLVVSVATQAAADAGLSGHAVSQAILGMALGVEMGLDADNVRKIGIVGLFENWGMVRVENELWKAERPLAPHEVIAIRKHPIYSLEVLQHVTGIPSIVSLIAYQMHERSNGGGYPRGRSGNSIHQFARILHVADAYTALTSPRPWRPPVMPYVAMEHLLRQAQQKAFDPAVVRALLNLLSLFPIGSFVSLSDGSAARVLRRHGADYARPIVQIVQRVDGRPVEPEDPSGVIDLAQSPLKILQALPNPHRTELSCVPAASSSGGATAAAVPHS